MSLERLLQPRSIAVYGGHFAEAVIRACDRMGYTGDICPVHPEREEILGRSCVRRTQDLSVVPDAAFVGVNRNATVEVVRTLADMGAGGAVCYASGFKEAGEEGNELQTRLIDAAGDMSILGPNCYGFINYLDGALLWPDIHGGRRIDRGVAVITQSSNIGVNLTLSGRGVPLAYLITVGNQAVVKLPHVVRALCDDDRVSAIGMYIEGISDTAAFSDAAEFAYDRGIPIVVLKSGRTETSRKIALSHTASLAGSDAVIDAYFKRLGLARVDSIPVLLEALKVLHVAGPLRGRDVASMSCSGGEASVVSDAAKQWDLCFRPFTEPDQARIKSTVNPLVSISNPFDYHTFDWGNVERLQSTFTAVMQSDFDLTVLVLDFPPSGAGSSAQWDLAWQALAGAVESTGHQAAVVSTLAECLPQQKCERLIDSGLIPLLGVDDGLAAIEAAAFFVDNPPRPVLPQPAIRGSAQGLSEDRGKALLQDYGIPVPSFSVCHHVDDAVAFLDSAGGPIVMKALGATLAHKSEYAGVILDLRSEDAVRRAYQQLSMIGDAVLAETMVTDGVAELIVGAARDPVIGLYLVLGFGGVLAEVLHDSQVLLLPVTEEEIEAALDRLQLAPVLNGWRGRPRADVEAVVQTVLQVERLVMANLDALEELDINPLIVRKENEGVVAVDAMARLVQ